jgi:hypothetical protein
MSRSGLAKRRILVALALAACAGAATGSAARSSPRTILCVGAKPGCFATVQAALDAAHDGDTIEIAAGTFQGGITIAKSVNLVGVAAPVTILRGGGPVVTIGDPSGAMTPTVSIKRVTITGGVTHSNPGGETAIAQGGGVLILGPAGGNGTGAIVTISDSVVTKNRTSPLTTMHRPCGRRAFGFCSFALGGGIDNSGSLTLTNTQVTDNVAGAIPGDPSVATDASGGGIDNHPGGTLTLNHSVVSGNTAAVGLPNGQFSDGGGLTSGGVLHVHASVVGGNSSTVEAAVPSSFFGGDTQQEANAGGIRLPEGSSTTIVGSTISGNSVSGSNTVGDAHAQAGAIDADGSLLLTDSIVSGNRVRADAPSGTLALGIEGGLQVSGSAVVHGGRISENAAVATSVGGFAASTGGGLDNLGKTTLEGTVVSGNSVTANGAFGVAHGGGVSNFTLDPSNPPKLIVLNSSITGNAVYASPGITPEGGGLWTDQPVLLVSALIDGNSPDDCVGC